MLTNSSSNEAWERMMHISAKVPNIPAMLKGVRVRVLGLVSDIIYRCNANPAPDNCSWSSSNFRKTRSIRQIDAIKSCYSYGVSACCPTAAPRGRFPSCFLRGPLFVVFDEITVRMEHYFFLICMVTVSWIHHREIAVRYTLHSLLNLVECEVIIKTCLVLEVYRNVQSTVLAPSDVTGSYDRK